MRRVGLFGGTFDPIHFGHLNLAIGLSEVHHLDEVWFIPARCNPHKKAAKPTASFEQRLKMVELALSPLPAFRVNDLEGKRDGPSYTVDTVEQLIREGGKELAFFLLMSDEAAATFSRWKQPERIISSLPILVGSRHCLQEELSQLAGSPPIISALRKGWTPLPAMEISSTVVRQRLMKGRFVGHLLPQKVVDYILKYRLYSANK